MKKIFTLIAAIINLISLSAVFVYSIADLVLSIAPASVAQIVVNCLLIAVSIAGLFVNAFCLDLFKANDTIFDKRIPLVLTALFFDIFLFVFYVIAFIFNFINEAFLLKLLILAIAVVLMSVVSINLFLVDILSHNKKMKNERNIKEVEMKNVEKVEAVDKENKSANVETEEVLVEQNLQEKAEQVVKVEPKLEEKKRVKVTAKLVEELERLAEYKNKGWLSQSEFDTLKNQIFDKYRY